MKPALFTGELMAGWYDSVPRYNTYEKLIKDHYGSITVTDVMAMLGCQDYWDGKEWHKNVLTLEPALDCESLWTPEARDADWKTLMRGVAVPSESTVYLMQGQSDTRMSTVPGATGKYCKLVLGDNPSAIIENAQTEAKLQMWYAARDLNLSANPSPGKDQKLNDAKLQMWQGYNLTAKGDLSEKSSDKQSLYGEALTCFCKAQIYAEQAQN